MAKFENPQGQNMAKLNRWTMPHNLEGPKVRLCPDERLVVVIRGLTVIDFNSMHEKQGNERLYSRGDACKKARESMPAHLMSLSPKGGGKWTINSNILLYYIF